MALRDALGAADYKLRCNWLTEVERSTAPSPEMATWRPMTHRLPRIQSVALVIDHLAQLLQLAVLGHGALADQCWTWLRIICKPNVRFVTCLSIISLSLFLLLSLALSVLSGFTLYCIALVLSSKKDPGLDGACCIVIRLKHGTV